MDSKRLIDHLENNTHGYYVVIGEDGYDSLSVAETYFIENYREEYTKKITLVIMLLISWLDAEILFETDDAISKNKHSKYNNRLFKLESAEDIRTLVKLISESMSDSDSRIHILFTDSQKQKFMMYIYGDQTIGFSELPEKIKSYIEKQLDKQGLSLYPDN